ncbi:unnamed protein product [Dibothriocephalus latus]|uniref:Receptor ligand binding region domain-containing protein n=1 Tax=Dibothriocephalus latus TaxID=60516 RepID=A0A3P7LSP2_DIBLA|nr:unnamed protein product [Dibothriocephalus latus]
MGSSNSCFQESGYYDLLFTVRTAVQFTISRYKSPLSLENVRLNYQVLYGCSNRNKARGLQLIRALDEMKNYSETARSWSVLLGPPLGGDCNIVSDWIANEAIRFDTHHSLYQVTYLCRSESIGRQFAQVDRPSVHESTDLNLASVSMAVQTFPFASAFQILLRYYGWQDVMVIFEVSEVRIQNHVFVEALRMYLAYSPPKFAPVRIVGVFALECSAESVSNYFSKGNTVDVILVIARPSMTLNFLRNMKSLKMLSSGKVAVVQFDPSSSNVYDALRAWRLAMNFEMEIGEAGLCLFILNTNPTGSGFDFSSPYLNSVRKQMTLS